MKEYKTTTYEQTWHKETNPFYDPISKLWISVILQAMADAKCKPSEKPSSCADRVCKTEQAQAKHLFEDETHGRSRLRELCELASVPLKTILKRYDDPNFDPIEAMRGISNVDPIGDSGLNKGYSDCKKRALRYQRSKELKKVILT